MTLKSDGTGIMEGVSLSWTEKDGEIFFSAGIYGSFSYKYSFKGSTLYLDDYAYKKIK